MDDKAARWKISAGQPSDYPGCWIIRGEGSDGEREWSYFRKEDGTYWEILLEDIFPRSGGALQVDLGNQVVDETILSRLREYYVTSTDPKFRLEVFDCAERGFRNFVDRESANQYRDW